MAQRFAILVPRIVEALAIREDAKVTAVQWPARVRLISAEVFNVRDAERVLGTVGERIIEHGDGPIERVARVNVFAHVAVRDKVTAFRAQNLSKITSIPDNIVSKLGTVIDEATNQGLRVEELAKQIQARADVAKSDAMRIARDQTLTLNAQVNQARQTAIGIKQAVWRTSQDGRVRESHAEMEGEVFSWDELPIVDEEQVAPGEPILCRCTAEAVIPDDFDFAALGDG